MRIVLLALCLVAACRMTMALPPAHDAVVGGVSPVFIDTAFTAEDRAVIQAAFVEWNAALGGNRTFVVIGEVQHPSTSWGVPAGAITVDLLPRDGLPGVLAYVPYVGGREIFVTPLRVVTRGVMLHEIGHVLGLDHSLGPVLMAPGIEGNPGCVDDSALQSLWSLTGWLGLKSTC